MRRRVLALAVVPVLLFGAACGDEGGGGATKAKVDMGEPIENVSVKGEVGSVPEVKIEAPLKITETKSQVITAGDGNPVVENEQALLHIYLANGTTGKKALTTYDQGAPYHLQKASDDQFFPSVLDAIVGKPVGSRVAVAAVPKDAYGEAGSPQLKIAAKDPVVFVVDIVSVEPTEVLDGPEGDAAAEIPGDIPTVQEKDGDVTKLGFEDASTEPGTELKVIPLTEGDGPEVRDDSLVTFNYLGQVYGTGEVFDESYSKEPVPFPVGIGGLIKGWDEGLVGLKEGSRVMIIAPPEFGYGAEGSPPKIPANATLAFVVDILGVDEPS